jgi:GNAT superfamily N-acetyltransferase
VGAFALARENDSRACCTVAVTVRRLRADEADALRDLRLRALQDSPWAFGSSYARELGHGPDWWEARARQIGDVVYVADGAGLVGMAGGFVPGAPDTVLLWGMWVAPGARGRGLGRALAESVIGWAGERRVELEVTDDERARSAAALYRSLGFEPTGERRPLDSDPALEAVVMTRSP